MLGAKWLQCSLSISTLLQHVDIDFGSTLLLLRCTICSCLQHRNITTADTTVNMANKDDELGSMVHSCIKAYGMTECTPWIMALSACAHMTIKDNEKVMIFINCDGSFLNGSPVSQVLTSSKPTAQALHQAVQISVSLGTCIWDAVYQGGSKPTAQSLACMCSVRIYSSAKQLQTTSIHNLSFDGIAVGQLPQQWASWPHKRCISQAWCQNL